MRNPIQLVLLAAASLLAISSQGVADPPLPTPFTQGQYDTPWGRGQLQIVGGLHATLTLADGSVLWGPLSNGNRRWEGRWVRQPDNVPPSAGFVKCTERRFAVPTSTRAPESDVWGHFTAMSGNAHENGRNAFFLRWASCNAPVPGYGTDAGYNFTATMIDYNAVSAAPAAATVPSLPYDGPCNAISQTAIVYVSPCQLDPFQRLTVVIRKDRGTELKKGMRRLVYTALSDDPDAVERALRNKTILPINSDRSTSFSDYRGGDFDRGGQSATYIPGGQLCRHRYWAVSLRIDATTEYKGLGIISLNCPRNSLDVRPPLNRKPRFQPAGN